MGRKAINLSLNPIPKKNMQTMRRLHYTRYILIVLNGSKFPKARINITDNTVAL